MIHTWSIRTIPSSFLLCRNPLFIRSMIHTLPKMKKGRIVFLFVSRNPLFIRSMIHTFFKRHPFVNPLCQSQSLIYQVNDSHGSTKIATTGGIYFGSRNPLFIRSMIHTLLVENAFLSIFKSQSLIYQVNDSHFKKII